MYRRLSAAETEASKAYLRELQADRDKAEKIIDALKEPVDSFPHQWALQYIKQAQAEEEKKTAEEKERDARRHAAEKMLLAKRRLEYESFSKYHSDR